MVVKKYYSSLLGQDTWGFDAHIKGRRVRKIGFASKENAETVLAKKRIEANERRAGLKPQYDPIPLDRIVKARIKQIGSATYTRRNAVRVLGNWLKLLPDALTAFQLTTADISRYRDKRLADGVKPQTVYRELTDIMACLNGAHELFAELSEWRPPRRPKLATPRGNRTVVISPDQVKAIIADLRRPKEAEEQRREYRARLDAADFFQIALQTMGRKSEVRTLAWHNVYWSRKKLQLDSKKTNEEGVIDIPDSLIEMLRRRQEGQNPKSPWVFPSEVTPARPQSRFRVEIIRQAAERCGIPWGYASPDGIVLHTTRHTGVTAMLDAGHDLPTVQAQSRHSTRQLLLRYGHATTRSRQAAVKVLDQFAPATGESPPSTLAAKSGSDGSPTSPHTSKGKGRSLAKRPGKEDDPTKTMI